MAINFSFLRCKLSRLLIKCSILPIATIAGILLNSTNARASQEIVLKYGVMTQSVAVADLETFVETGKMSPSLRFLIGVSKQEPENVRQALTKELGVSPTLLSDIFNSLPGEYGLFQAGQIIHPKFKPNRALIPGLRGALIISASGDNKISMLELFQNYPTQQMYVDAKLLKNTSDDVIDFINRVGDKFEVQMAIAKDFIEDMVCDCDASAQVNYSDRITQK